jgi:pimeloyl-ACP methyl ester carboxylesterase
MGTGSLNNLDLRRGNLEESGRETGAPFMISIPEETLARIGVKVRVARFPSSLADPNSWQYGVSHAVMREIVDYWIHGYDWRAAEELLNRYPQFHVQVDNFLIHYYFVEGRRTDLFPILFTHGWPGSVYEFLKTIAPVTDAGFSVVIPSLPGFGFSSKPLDGPVGPVTIARLWHTLMTERLGFKHYGVQGGDLGSVVSAQLAYMYPREVVGLHLNLVPTPHKTVDDQNEDERKWFRDVIGSRSRECDYFQEQAHKPSTLSFVLNNNPVGLAAWILDKFKIWSGCGSTIAPTFTFDDLLTSVMIYLVTDTVDSSVWFYRGLLEETGGNTHPGWIGVPTAVADYPHELPNGRPPESLIRHGYNLVRYRRLPKGGHFAAIEQPGLFSADIIDFFLSIARES